MRLAVLLVPQAAREALAAPGLPGVVSRDQRV